MSLIDNHTSASNYNLDHLNKLAEAMGCSPKDFIPISLLKTKEKADRTLDLMLCYKVEN